MALTSSAEGVAGGGFIFGCTMGFLFGGSFFGSANLISTFAGAGLTGAGLGAVACLGGGARLGAMAGLAG